MKAPTTPEEFHAKVKQWAMDESDELSNSAAALIGLAKIAGLDMEAALQLVAIAFCAGYTQRARDQVDEETNSVLADFEPTGKVN